MVKGLHITTICIAVFFIVSGLCNAAEIMDDASLDTVDAKAGVTIALPEFVYSESVGHTALGGYDGLGIPEAPDGGWFVLESTRTFTVDLSGSVFDIDVISVGRDDTNYSEALRDAIYKDISDTSIVSRAVLCIDFGATEFIAYSDDSRLTLNFGNNKEGQQTGEDGVTESNLFTEEIAQFQTDGATMTISSEDATMYIFAHPEGNFEITPP